MLAYITDKCDDDATTHGILAELRKLADKVESEQTTKLFDHFPADFIVKKKFGNYNNRVIGKHVSIKTPSGDEIDVAVLLRVLIRGSHDYIAFSHNPIEYGASHLEPLIDHEKLKLWVAERVTTRPAEPMPQISEKEYGFLYNALVQKVGSSFVAESHSWFASVTSEENREYLYTIGKEILTLAEQKIPGKHIVTAGPRKILARYFHNSDILVLIHLGKSIPETHEILELSDNATSDEIDVSCRRKYPDYLLADLSLWMNIQKDKAGNLALSPEESSVLNSVRQMHNPTPFPLFINGRAGSGKSTIIQYIFCDLLRYWFKELPTENPPIYLTYNKSLLDSARATIESLLMHDAGSQGSYDSKWIEEHREQLDCSLREFHEFLYSHLEPHEHARFPRSARMTFSRFKEEWEIGQAKNPSSAELGPDLCWHVLRTFIKGFESDLDSYLEPDDYDNLEGGIKASINSEIYKLVYEAIFKNWYEGLCSHEESSNYWDDQDLVRFLLHKERLKPLHPAIVCDEAQDFTRVELHAILTLNLFSARSLNRLDVPMIPLIFAGDQFQTLNPTGFRWESIKSWFVENFIRKIDPTSKRNDLNYRELSYNYRSTSEIVRFSNLVQYQRGELFNILNEIEPQHPWLRRVDAPVMHFRPNDANLWEKLTTTISNAVFIVPCEDDELQEYIANDKVLKERIQYENGTPLTPVMCPSKAKGLEFQDVVLYRFGAKFSSLGLDPKERRLEAEYFVNRLYVGVTRPKKRLLILDDESGMKFWDFAKQPDVIEKKLASKSPAIYQRWNNTLTQLVEGSIESLENKSSIEEYEETAKQMFESAKNTRDAFTMRQAAIQYRQANKHSKYNECQAWAASFDGRHLDSAVEFDKAGMWKEAALQYFCSADDDGWQKLGDLASKRIELSKEPYLRLIDAWVHKAASWEQALCDTSADLQSGKFTIDDPSQRKSWTKLVAFFLDASFDSGNTGKIYDCFVLLKKSGIHLQEERLGYLAFRIEEWQKAIDHWDLAKTNKHPEYKEAKKKIVSGLDILSVYHAEGKFDEIISTWKGQYSTAKLTSEQAFFICDALIFNSKYTEASTLINYEIISSANTRELWANLFTKIGNAEAYTTFKSLCDIAANKWNVEEWERLTSLESIDYIYRLASSTTSLVDLPADKKKQIATHLMQYWLKNKSKLQGPFKESTMEMTHCLNIGATIEKAGNRKDAIEYYREISKISFPNKYHAYIESRLFQSEMRRARFNKDPKQITEVLRKYPGKTFKATSEYPPAEDIKSILQEYVSILQSALKSHETNADNDIPEKLHIEENTENEGSDLVKSEPVAIPEDTRKKEANQQSPDVSDHAKDSQADRNGIISNFQFKVSNLTIEGFSKTQRVSIKDDDGRDLKINLSEKTIVSHDFSISLDDTSHNIDDWGIEIDRSHQNSIHVHFKLIGMKLIF